MRKNIAILGATGSIGRSALEVIEHLGEPYRVVAVSGHTRTSELLQIANQFDVTAIGVSEVASLPDMQSAADSIGARLYRGSDGLCEMVCRDDVDIVISAIVGAAGLAPTLAAVQSGKRLALANKESLVIGGSILIPEARRSGCELLPVDSEHSAIFQCLAAGKLSQVNRIILTASGGPFRDWSADQIENATLEDAMNHPTWQMGQKVTIDSASLFNKALELIEACWLFDIAPEKIEVVIHPESIVHSMIEFVDGSTLAQLSPPDMKTPIQYALTYPDRLPGCSSTLDLTATTTLRFFPPDQQRFPSLRLAYETARVRGTMGAVLNAANEVAVKAFIGGRLTFGAISRIVERTMQRHDVQRDPSLDDLLEADRFARRTAEGFIATAKN